ncbi:MAG: glycosyl hydrolase family 2 [Bacteroidetes bacterium]|nr:MAG: glycosyl hydrolase family 2 [Bacteroidota bacterium]
MRLTTICFILFLTLISCQSNSNLKLPSLIGDNMILQQKTNVKIWGKATPGHKINVSGSWKVNSQTKTGDGGKWAVVLPTPEAGGPYTITISGNDTSVVIKNVLIGEVWFCSGQSNMEMPLEGWPPVDTIMHSAETISSASIPEIRMFNVLKKISGEPLEDCTGSWEVSTPVTVKPFSATAYFFGKKLYNELHVPIGLIESAWGGTPSESWTSSTALEKSGEFVSDLKAIKESAPLQNEYQSWLNNHRQVELKPGGDEQWKDLIFNDEKIPSAEYNDNEWPVMVLPTLFEKVIGEFDGAVWFRKKVELKQDMAGKDLILSLGPIDDMDRTYFNGELIGSTEASGKWKDDRNYDIPASMVKNGANIISVRVLDPQGGGGIYGAPEKMKLSLKNDIKVTVPLNGGWKYQPVAELTGNKFYIYDITKSEFLTRIRPISIGPNTPSVLFNGMVSPVLPFQIKGAIWYQGEANVGRADQYAKIFPVMIQNWREAWGIRDFPFYFVQIAPYVYSGVDSTESAWLRESQEKALNLVNTGMVATFDIATVMNIHPPFKKEVGERLALLTLNNDYGIKNQCIGPVYKSMTVEGKYVKLQFQNAGDGMVAKNNKLTEFEIAGQDGKYAKANAKIVNNEVLVSSSAVPNPIKVRYCWRNGAEASLFNKAGFPAWQFRTK